MNSSLIGGLILKCKKLNFNQLLFMEKELQKNS